MQFNVILHTFSRDVESFFAHMVVSGALAPAGGPIVGLLILFVLPVDGTELFHGLRLVFAKRGRGGLHHDASLSFEATACLGA